MIAVPDIERKVALRLRREVLFGKRRRDEKAVRVRMQVHAVQPPVGVVDELRHRQVVEHRRERMEVAFEAGLGRPAVERDTALVGRVASRHPFAFLDAEGVEEAAQPRRRAFADTDDADDRRLEHLDLDALGQQCGGERHRSHPAGRATADDDDLADRRRQMGARVWLRQRERIVEEGGGRRHALSLGGSRVMPDGSSSARRSRPRVSMQ